ncbi:MAG: MBL fold metallo-hydrolase [Calditrichaceae bacterium]
MWYVIRWSRTSSTLTINMQIQNKRIISGHWKFQIIHDGLFHINPPKNSNHKNLAKNIHCFPVNYLLAESDTVAILVDLGIGSLPGHFFSRCENLKHIPITEKLMHIKSKKLAAIVFSHLHLDHMGNYLEFDGLIYSENFKNIPCYVSRLEWEFRTKRFSKADDVYKKYYKAIAKNIQLTEDGQEVFPGIETKYIGGHTPGHQTILFKTEEFTLCYSGDIIATENQLYKNRSLPFDFDPEKSKKIRKKILDEGRKNQWIFALNHAPHVNFKLLEKTEKNL